MRLGTTRVVGEAEKMMEYEEEANALKTKMHETIRGEEKK
jgi:hypothetical protein